MLVDRIVLGERPVAFHRRGTAQDTYWQPCATSDGNKRNRLSLLLTNRCKLDTDVWISIANCTPTGGYLDPSFIRFYPPYTYVTYNLRLRERETCSFFTLFFSLRTFRLTEEEILVNFDSLPPKFTLAKFTRISFLLKKYKYCSKHCRTLLSRNL